MLGERQRMPNNMMKILSHLGFGALAVIPSTFSPQVPVVPDVVITVMWEKLAFGLAYGHCPLPPCNLLLQLEQSF